VNRAPLAAGVARELCCGVDDVCEERQVDASDLRGSDEIMSVVSPQLKKNSELGRYEVYTVSPQLKEGLGVAFIDSGSMVSQVKESSVTRFRYQGQQVRLQGITGKQMNVMGLIDLKIQNALETVSQKCYVVDSLPRNLDVILG
jgi:hypothetical protein